MSWCFIVVIALLLMGCGSGRPPDIASAQSDFASLSPQSWDIMYSEGTPDHPDAAADAAWTVSIPTDGLLSYVQTPYPATTRPQQIVMRYRIVASPDSIPYSSEAHASPCRDHNPCTPVAEFHVFFWQRDADFSELGRWWNKEGFRLTNVPDDSFDAQPFVADGQVHAITIPLIADQWTSVTGKGSPADFERALQNIGWVGITFGGSDFFAQGVTMGQGTLQFEMVDFRVE